ncbi:hypothetical protein GQ607_005954, partial [Colletotrichum asianum]
MRYGFDSLGAGLGVTACSHSQTPGNRHRDAENGDDPGWAFDKPELAVKVKRVLRSCGAKRPASTEASDSMRVSPRFQASEMQHAGRAAELRSHRSISPRKARRRHSAPGIGPDAISTSLLKAGMCSNKRVLELLRPWP